MSGTSRDPERTKRELKGAVSTLLKTKGFGALKTNEISRTIDKDKTLIKHHFSSLKNLLKTFIAERDYWDELFEKFGQADSAGSAEIMNLFTSMMQDNFEIFSKDEEMQNIIRWQISEENPLLKEISDAREESGKRLIDLTDPLFEGTDIDFRAILALILGGTYYVVLHSNTNKSVVCGLDISTLEGRVAFQRTIAQVIQWAWEATAR